MKKEDLIAMGLTEEQAGKVLESLNGSFVTKTRFNEVNEENKTLKKTVGDRDKQLEDLKKSSGDSEALKKQIETLQDENKTKDEDHAAEIKKLKVEGALRDDKAKNVAATMALLDLSKIEVAEDGTLKGYSEQSKALKGAEDTKFLFGSDTRSMRGAKPGQSEDGDTLDESTDQAVEFAKGLAKSSTSESVNKANDYYFKS